MAQKPTAESGKSLKSEPASKRVVRGFPPHDIQTTLIVAKAIADQNAGRPYSRLSLAEAIGRKPDSSGFRTLLSASIQYGLTEGSHNVSSVSLTPLGLQIVMPKSERERRDALLKAARNVPIFAKLYESFDQAKLPVEQNFRNTLIREYDVHPEAATQCIAHFKSDGIFVGLIRTVAGSERVDIPHAEGSLEPPELLDSSLALGDGQPPDDDEPVTPPPPSEGRRAESHDTPSAIFIAHGHDLEALTSLENLLKQMGVKYVIAKDEAHAGRPITQKVAEEMKRCSAGIFIASADDAGFDAKGGPVMRARQNVVYELGAASLLYGQRIVIFKETGVEFPSDFGDLGYISYKRGHLAENFADLIRELVKLNAIKISAGG